MNTFEKIQNWRNEHPSETLTTEALQTILGRTDLYGTKC